MATIVFDLDGTLADTAGDLIAAANAVFGAMGYPGLLDPHDDASTAFRGARAMLRLGLERAGHGPLEAEIEARYPEVLAAYGAALNVHTRLYPGAVEAVRTLRDEGYRTAICTNKPEGLSRRLLDAYAVGGLFDALIGADTLPVRKPDPLPFREAVRRAGGDPERAILIGDTETDRDTARAANVPCVLVTFGPDGEGVADLAPEALLRDYAALPALAADLLGAPVRT